jgi:hypothetical protein
MTANNGHHGSTELTTLEAVRGAILHLPGRPPFMLARDLAAAYECEARQIKEARQHNHDLFPEPDACFVLTREELDALRAGASETPRLPKTATARGQRGYTRLGANMLASFIRTRTAKERLLLIMRAFSALEEAAQAAAGPAPTEEPAYLLRKLNALGSRLTVLERRLAGAEKRGAAVQALEALVERAEGMAGAPAPEASPQPPPEPGTVTIPAEEYIALLKAENDLLRKTRRERHTRRPITDAERAEAFRLKAQGLGTVEIARRMGRPSGSVACLLARGKR